MRILLLILSIILSASAYAQQQKIKPGDVASKYVLRIVTSKESIKKLSVADLKEIIIIMLWWDRGCHYSKEDLKSFNAYYKKYGNEVSFYAVSNDALSYIEKFKEKNNYKFTYCQDAAGLENKFFPYTAKGHMVIINRKGICLHHGSFMLSNTLLDTLIAKDQLPAKSQSKAIESYKFKQFRNEFGEYSKSLDSYLQTGFKLEPYKSSITNGIFIYAPGKYYYGYNQPVYDIYREGLFLKDASIIIPGTLKQKLSAIDTANLYLVGFNLRKENKFSRTHYRKVFKTYLDSAFSLSTRLVKKNENLILVTKINEGANVLKIDYTGESKIRGDTLSLVDYNAEKLVAQLNIHYSFNFLNGVINQGRYDINLVLPKDSTDREQVVQQLKIQGIDSKIVQKKTQYLEFQPEKEGRSVAYMHTKQKSNSLKTGFNIGFGKSLYNYSDESYHGNKTFAFKTGFFIQVRLKNYLSLQPAISYMINGSSGNYAEFKIHTITTPLNFLLTTSQQKPMGLYVKAGGYYAYNFAGRVEGQNLSFGNNIEKNIFGWTYSFGLWFGNNGSLELSYIRGLSNIIKNSTIGDVKEKIWLLTKLYYF